MGLSKRPALVLSISGRRVLNFFKPAHTGEIVFVVNETCCYSTSSVAVVTSPGPVPFWQCFGHTSLHRTLPDHCSTCGQGGKLVSLTLIKRWHLSQEKSKLEIMSLRS